MRKQKRWRYFCDFCKKAGGHAGYMKKHESRCTLNPNRHCGFCDLIEEAQPDLQEAIKLLPNPKEYEKNDDAGWSNYDGLQEAVDKALPVLRDYVNNCPACILAALRQSNIPPVMTMDKFDFKKEFQSVWDDFNEAQREEAENAAYYE